MKNILFFALTIALTSCVGEIISIEYHSTTMMGRTVVTVDADSIIVAFNGRGEPKRDAFSIKDGEWESILKSLEKVNLNEIANLEAPSERRFTDAAPYAYFVIETKDSTYKSNTFDGGNPHEMLAPLMGEINKINERVKKK